MNRRQFSSLVALALGGTIHSRALGALLDSNNKHIFLRDAFTDYTPTTLSDSQRATVAAISEVIMPETDTPGAITAKVPVFIERLIGEWMTVAEKQKMLDGIASVEQQAQSQFGTAYASASAEQQLSLLEAMEDAADDHPWYELGADSGLETDAPFIAVIKELTIFGFFMSEVGATQVLTMNHVPGRFEGDIPLDPDQSSWAPVPLM